MRICSAYLEIYNVIATARRFYYSMDAARCNIRPVAR